jgi:hypothetical protein
MKLDVVSWILIFSGVAMLIAVYISFIIWEITSQIQEQNEYYREQLKLRLDAREIDNKAPILFK